MSGDRPFPASARRLADARRAGRIAWSPALVAGAAFAGGALAVAAIGRAWVAAAGRAIGNGASATRLDDPIAAATGVRASAIVADIVALVAPLLALVAAAAILTHVAQTRGVWVPRRRARRLPPAADGPGRRGVLALLGLARAGVVVAVAGGVIASATAALAAHTGDAAGVATLGATLAVTVLGAAAAAAIAIALVDWLERARRIRAGLAMSARDVREERRESEADPRWRRARAGAGAGDDDAIRRSLVVLVAGDAAVAIAWHARWQPVPRITATARGLAGARLAALARRHRVAVLREVALVDALAALGPGRTIPDRLHAALARVVVAVT